MVTAGVFLSPRMSPLFELSTMPAPSWCGRRDHCLLRGNVGLVSERHQAVIAYSTCSQLGYMFVALGVGAYGAASSTSSPTPSSELLFLCAGSVIHAVDGEQDMRHMGGLRKHIPITYWTMFIGTIALTGVGIPGTMIGTAASSPRT